MATGKIIGAIAKAKGYNLHKLAVEADIPYNSLYSMVERDTAKVKPQTLTRIAAVLDVAVADLIDFTDYTSSDIESLIDEVEQEVLYNKFPSFVSKNPLLFKMFADMGFTFYRDSKGLAMRYLDRTPYYIGSIDELEEYSYLLKYELTKKLNQQFDYNIPLDAETQKYYDEREEAKRLFESKNLNENGEGSTEDEQSSE